MPQPRRLSAFALAVLSSVFLSLPHLGAAQKENAHAAIIIVTPEANQSTLEDFSWPAGRWEGHLGPTTAEQQWMAPKNGTMQGFFRLTDAKTIVIELFTIRETPSGIEFYFRHFRRS
jgi:hypothetical protein